MGLIAMVAVGLGLVIFVHELGHFAVAKWCDVFVQTFSIGFGPALPGCRWKWGETVYKIALLPLGGYVQMLGEGTDDEEEQNNPRSYRNKPVGQRMMIISAGVVMNVTLACVCFILVYMIPGKERTAGEVGWVEIGGPAWEAGVPSGAVFTQIGSRERTGSQALYFDRDLQPVVINSAEGNQLPIAYEFFEYDADGDPSSKPLVRRVEVAPRKQGKPGRPMLGVSPSEIPELITKQFTRGQFPYFACSAAAAARKGFFLHQGDVIVAATDPDHPDALKSIPGGDRGAAGGPSYTFELSKRWVQLAGRPMTVQLRGGADPNAAVQELKLEPGRFEFGDTILATTDPDHPDKMKPLPEDPRNPGSGRLDFFALGRREQQLIGQFMVVRVRHLHGAEEDLTLPPAFNPALGVSMRMGPVVALRANSPAAKAGAQKGDILKEVTLKAGGQEQHFLIGEGKPEELVDPMHLPAKLQAWADARAGDVKVVLTVVRKDSQTEKDRVPERLPEVAWDDSWRFDREIASGKALGLPCVGLAYRVDSLIEDVAPGSPAQGQLQKNDVVKAYKLQEPGTKPGEFTWSNRWVDLDAGQWPRFAAAVLPGQDSQEVMLRIERPGQSQPVEVTLTAEPDPTWPTADHGLIFMPDARLQKASNVGQAVVLGFQDTYDTILLVYQQIRAVATRQVDPENLGGPIRIAVIAYAFAGRGFWEFVFFMGLISVNLAVINFLPIPFLDGGHMVFLIYEKFRGKPARDAIIAAATYAGVLLLLLVMVFVFYQDIKDLVVRNL
jgi:regulator of sigma E protease